MGSGVHACAALCWARAASRRACRARASGWRAQAASKACRSPCGAVSAFVAGSVTGWACPANVEAAHAAATVVRRSHAFVRVLRCIRCSSVDNNPREIGKRRPRGRVVPDGAACCGTQSGANGLQRRKRPASPIRRGAATEGVRVGSVHAHHRFRRGWHWAAPSPMRRAEPPAELASRRRSHGSDRSPDPWRQVLCRSEHPRPHSRSTPHWQPDRQPLRYCCWHQRGAGGRDDPSAPRRPGSRARNTRPRPPS